MSGVHVNSPPGTIMPRPRKANPSKDDLASRKWYLKNKKYKDTRAKGRMAARRKMVKAVGKAKLKGKEIDHKDGNPSNNKRSNLRIAPKSHGRKTYSRKQPTRMRHK